jgi:hypothetical protein
MSTNLRVLACTSLEEGRSIPFLRGERKRASEREAAGNAAPQRREKAREREST